MHNTTEVCIYVYFPVKAAYVAQWNRRGPNPNEKALDLATVIRPQINEITLQLLGVLSSTQSIRDRSDCPVQIEEALNQLVVQKAINVTTEADRTAALCTALSHLCVKLSPTAPN